MTRAEWVELYRLNRQADRLWSFMQDRFDGVPSFVDDAPRCPGFSADRLRGDVIGRFPLSVTGLLAHKVRMYDLERRPVLPA